MPLIVKYFITLTLIFVTNAVWAQTAIAYEYDDAGNRISRRIASKSNGIFKSQIKSHGQHIGEQGNSYDGNNEIDISYCETTSSLSVGIIPSIGNITVYALDGKQVLHVNLPTSGGKIDLNGLPDGIYTIDVFCGQQHILRKIAKQTTTPKL